MYSIFPAVMDTESKNVSALKMPNILKWTLWILAAAALIFVVFVSSLLTVAYRENSSLEYLFVAMIVGITLNLLFKDTRVLYTVAAALPILSMVILPQAFPTIMALLVAIVWFSMSFGLSKIRNMI